MKLDTVIIIAKGLCYLIIGVFTPWTTALAQWVNSGEWPGKIIWLGVIVPASAIGGASSLLAFLSGSWTDYKAKRNAGGTDFFVNPQPKIEPPKTP